MSCCTFPVFIDDFNHYFPLYFDVPPTAQQLKNARSDWRAGNTGYEAAHNAKNRAKDAAAKALEKPLVHLRGRHFAYDGSTLAKQPKAAPNTPPEVAQAGFGLNCGENWLVNITVVIYSFGN